MKTAKGPSGPLKNLLKIRKDTIGFLMDCYRDYGDIVSFKVHRFPICLVSHPDHIKYVLQDNNRNYTKNTVGWKRLREFFGNGLLTSEGDFWLRQRRMTQPLFQRKKIQEYASTITDITENMLQRWQQHAQQKTTINLMQEMLSLSLNILGNTLLMSDLSKHTHEAGEALNVLAEQANSRITGLSLPRFIPTKANRVYYRAEDVIEDVVKNMIEEKRKDSNDDGFLAMLVNARDEETGEGMSDQQLRDEVMSIFLAGHETTAVALTWTWYLLCQHPTIREKLRADIVKNIGEDNPTLENLKSIPYSEMVLKEVMRLYPPVWSTARSAKEQDEIGGVTIVPDTMVITNMFIVHRHPRYWENPEGFDPYRFAPEKEKNIHRYAYFPFGGGPHQCIGNYFAMMSAHLAMVKILQRYRIDLAPCAPMKFDPSISLRPKYPIYATVSEY